MKRGRNHAKVQSAWKWFFNPVVKKGPNTKGNSQVNQSDEVQAKSKSKNTGRLYMGGNQPDNVRELESSYTELTKTIWQGAKTHDQNLTQFPKYKHKHRFVHKQMQVRYEQCCNILLAILVEPLPLQAPF